MDEHMQETFDAMVWHMRKQGRRSVAKNKYGTLRCRYRTSNGDMCPVGYLIPDDEYLSCFEGKGVTFDPIFSVLTKYGHNISLCVSMQIVHDQHEPKEWEREFAKVAKNYGLKYKRQAAMRIGV